MTLRRTLQALVLPALLLAAGCANQVFLPDGTPLEGTGGTGGSGGGTGGGGAGGTQCMETCSIAPSGGTCNCDWSCSGSPLRVRCSDVTDLQGEQKVECICTVDDTFTGVCFETEPAVLCDFQHGCCSKYLGK
jgi:hypothetical protein